MTKSLLTALTLIAAAAARAQYHVVTIDTPGTDTTFVEDINDAGRWAGYTQTAFADSPVGYLNGGILGNADGSGVVPFGRAGSFSIGASGINEAGEISGVSIDATFTGTGFIRSPTGAYADVSPTGPGITSAYSEAIDLNDAGALVGYYTESRPTSLDDIDSDSHGFVLDRTTGVYTRIDAPVAGAHGTQLYSVNDAGTVSGRYLDAAGTSHGFLYDLKAGTYQYFSSPTPVTDDFELGGLANDGDFTAVAYVTTPAGRFPLSFIHSQGSFVPFAIPGALATLASGLNDRGQVVGVYAAPDLSIHGFTATPVPEPAPFAVVGVGALALLRRRKQG